MTSPQTARFRARDLGNAPALLCWFRLLLALVFPAVVSRPVVAVIVLAAAGVSDMLDGYIARRYGLVSAAGAILDAICDKLFVLSVLLSLWLSGHMSLVMIALLATRDIAEIPLALWYARRRRSGRVREDAPMANAGGKRATVLQFCATSWALFRLPMLELWVAAASLAGAVAAFEYWRRALSGENHRSRPLSRRSRSGVALR